MIFNRFIFVLVVAVVILSSCQKSNQFTIAGKITHAEGDTIYLEEFLVSTSKPVAKKVVNNKGEFEFKGETSIPTFYLLKLSDKFIVLLVDSIDNVFVEADAANFGREYIVQGSLGSIQVKELTENLNRTEHKLDSLRQLNNISKGNPDYKRLNEKWTQEFATIIEEQTKFSTNFVLNNPFSMASVYALYQKYRVDQSLVIRDLQTMRTAASALNAIYPNSNLVKALYENTLKYLREEKAVQMKQFIEKEGVNSPDIILPNVNGKEIALSSLRGKVVLLHFWAAEDPGSRMLNTLLADAYKKYKNKGLEIYQVNVGVNRSEWIDVIDKDELNWINVGDMEGSTKARLNYNIQSIPYNYLLDKEGKIVAKNLTGPELDKALAMVLK